MAIGTEAESGFVDQMQCQAWLNSFGGQTRPGPQQIPSAQAQMLGRKKPDSDLIARNLVSEHLADLALQAGGVDWLESALFASALGLDKLRRVGGVKFVEFFFAGRNRR